MILKFIFRNLTKRPFLNLIKVLGLSLALTGLLVITFFLKNELTFDSSHKKSKQIYRYSITSENFFGGKHFARVNNSSYIPQMKDYFPEIENYVRLAPIRGGYVKYNEKFVSLNQAFECDSTFLKIFDCELIVGNAENILNNPGSMIISESFAKKIFGDNNPVGQVLSLPKGQYYAENKEFTVNGIMKDFKQNNHFHPDFIVAASDKSIFEGWAWIYLLLNENADPHNIESNFKVFYSSVSGIDKNELKIEAHLQNISKIHLSSDKLREIEANGSMSVIYTLSIAALILLFIALTNYANLNIGMASFSDKFLYINKLTGSSNRLNFKFYLTEGLIITIITIAISGFLTGIVNDITLKHFELNLFAGNLPLGLLIILLFGLLAVLSGISPLYQQAVNKADSFLNLKSESYKRKGISKGLIILQYTISIVLIIAVIVIQRQTNFALKSSMGADTGNPICLEDVHTDVQQKFELFKNELLKYNSIESVSAMFEPPGGEANDLFQFEMEGYIPDESNKLDNMIGIFPCDYSFASIFKLDFLSGNNFSEKYDDNEGSGEYIINEAAMKRLNYFNPDEIEGKEFDLTFNYADIAIPKGKIIGVVKDFNFSSIRKKIEPLVFFKRKDMWISNFIIYFNSENKSKAINDIESVWNKLFAEYPFQYKYLSSMHKNVYRKEMLQASLLSIFTIMALFICSMGLLGMSLLVTQRRTKEIGIRKVNGAKISELMFMLNWDLIKWIVISFVIAVPIAFIAMNKWLENFAYKIPLSWWIFTLAGIIAIIISLITISIISWKAANSNPVNALRYE